MVNENDLRKAVAALVPEAGQMSLGALAEQVRQKVSLVETESFANLGGWKVDTQYIENMGSPFLLAHGIGTPVNDAATRVSLPRAGAYRVYARTRDWVVYPSQFQPPSGGVRPGSFQVWADGQALPEILGADGNGTWHWQVAGRVMASEGTLTLTLHDLMGFDARCDALLFVAVDAGSFLPPDGGPELAALRGLLLGWDREPEEAGTFDMVVAGGGFAGMCAALTAAQHGLRTAIVQDRAVYGGPGSSEIKVSPIRHLRKPPYPRNGDLMVKLYGHGSVKAYSDLSEVDKMRDQVMSSQPNLTTFREMAVVDVEMNGSEISAVIAQHVRTGKRLRIRGYLFSDCTGDSLVGVKAGAEYRQGREGRAEFGEPFAPLEPDSMLLGNSLYWWAAQDEAESAFPETPWALPVASDEMYEVPRPKWPQPPKEGVAFAGGWNWETGWRLDNTVEGERIRDHMLRAIFGTYSYMKNHSGQPERWARTHLAWVGYINGKRESKRLMGDFLLDQNHIMTGELQRDASVTATWYFDLHFPHPENSRFWGQEEFRSVAFDDPQWERWSHVAPGWYQEIEPYTIPYRCLYSRNIGNLYMAGRNISVTHVGLAPVRTMMCTAQMGTVVGRAASLCVRHECSPREIYTEHLSSLLSLLADPGVPGLSPEETERVRKMESPT